MSKHEFMVVEDPDLRGTPWEVMYRCERCGLKVGDPDRIKKGDSCDFVLVKEVQES